MGKLKITSKTNATVHQVSRQTQGKAVKAKQIWNIRKEDVEYTFKQEYYAVHTTTTKIKRHIWFKDQPWQKKK